ncbi:MAG: flagellar basal body P-ring formation chaperone FlgA [Pseudomonadota bacterium]
MALILHRQSQLMVSFIIGLIMFGLAREAMANERVDIPVPKNVIYAGQPLIPDLLRNRSVPINYVRRVSVIQNQGQLIGKIARKTLMPNQPIFTNTVVEPNVIEVNRKALMRFEYGGLKITTEVNPLNSAKSGQPVRARNIRTGVVVYGTAVADGSILASSLQ